MKCPTSAFWSILYRVKHMEADVLYIANKSHFGIVYDQH